MVANHAWSLLRHLIGGWRNLWIILALALIGWMTAGIYSVAPGERADILRFGAVVRTSGPGLHFRLPPPIERLRLAPGAARRESPSRMERHA
jgi:regulator of protease activity HflC (stomatin/prohibitin superfamily)